MINNKYLHPEKVQIELKVKMGDFQRLTIAKDRLSNMISDFLDNMRNIQSDKEYVVASKKLKKMQNTFDKLLVEISESEAELLKLESILKVSASKTDIDRSFEVDVSSSLADADIIVYRKLQDSIKDLTIKEGQKKKLLDMAKAKIGLEDKLFKGNKKSDKKLENMLLMADMSPEERMITRRTDKVDVLKRATVGSGIIATIATFFFPPLAVYTVPLLVTGTVIGVGAKKSKNVQALLAVPKNSMKNLKKELQSFAYDTPQVANNAEYHHPNEQNQNFGGF